MKILHFNVGIIETNCFLVTDKEAGESVLIDPGAMSPRLEDALKEHNVKHIILTHGHYDHILGVAQAKRITGADVIISAEDAPCLYDDEKSRAGLHFPEPQEHLYADRTVSDGDEIAFGNKKIRVIATPGHTPGCVCFVFDEDGIIFSGDTLFQGTIGRTDFATGSMSDMLASLAKIKAIDGEFTVFPGHGPATTLDYEKQNNPYMRNL